MLLLILILVRLLLQLCLLLLRSLEVLRLLLLLVVVVLLLQVAWRLVQGGRVLEVLERRALAVSGERRPVDLARKMRRCMLRLLRHADSWSGPLQSPKSCHLLPSASIGTRARYKPVCSSSAALTITCGGPGSTAGPLLASMRVITCACMAGDGFLSNAY